MVSFTIILLSKLWALLYVQLLSHRDSILKISTLTVQEIHIGFAGLSPGYDTLLSSWFMSSNRWINFIGIPYHLRTFHGFGMLCKLRIDGSACGNYFGVRVLVPKCDIKKTPQFVPMVDLGGVTCPIRILLDDYDSVLCNGDSRGTVSHEETLKNYLERRSFADVVSSQRSTSLMGVTQRSSGSILGAFSKISGHFLIYWFLNSKAPTFVG